MHGGEGEDGAELDLVEVGAGVAAPHLEGHILRKEHWNVATLMDGKRHRAEVSPRKGPLNVVILEEEGADRHTELVVSALCLQTGLLTAKFLVREEVADHCREVTVM